MANRGKDILSLEYSGGFERMARMGGRGAKKGERNHSMISYKGIGSGNIRDGNKTDQCGQTSGCRVPEHGGATGITTLEVYLSILSR